MKVAYKINNYKFQFALNRIDRINSLTVFNYHQIGKNFNASEQTKGTYTQSDFFEEQMQWLKNNYTMVSLEEGLEKMYDNALEGRCVALTFDDGDKSNLEAMEILKRHNIPATFFINSGYLDNANAYWYNIYNFIKHSPKYTHLLTQDLEDNVKSLRRTDDPELYNKYAQKVEILFDSIKEDFDVYLSLSDLEQMNSTLFHVGSHGFEHQRFSMMSAVWQKENMEKDLKILRHLKNFKAIFAIPFGRAGDWNKDTIRIALELGLDIVFADEGVNYKREVGCKRIPADSRQLKELM